MAEKTTKRNSRIRPELSSDFMDVKQTSAYTGLGKRTLYRLANSGEVPAYRVGNILRFSRSSLDQWGWERAMQNLKQEAGK